MEKRGIKSTLHLFRKTEIYLKAVYKRKPHLKTAISRFEDG